MSMRLPLGLFSSKVGLSPGSAVFMGEQKVENVSFNVIEYGDGQYHQSDPASLDDPIFTLAAAKIRWINVVGVHDVDVLQRLGELHTLHPLTIEDIANTGHRAKLEEFDGYLYVVLRMLRQAPDNSVVSEQVSVILTENTLLTIQEQNEDVFEPVRKRIRSGKGRIQTHGVDYLMYALIDAIVDNYFVVLEGLTIRADAIGRELYNDPGDEMLEQINVLKEEVLDIRRDVLPVRELINRLQRDESGVLQEPLKVFMRDLYDHVIQVLDTIEHARVMLDGMGETYLSALSRRMNEVMKTLTIFSTIFLPLTFVAGLYGMNFVNMPELSWTWGYPAALLLMLLIGLGMFVFFKTRKWF